MKLLDTLKSWEHTFTSFVVKAYTAFRNEEPTVIAVADRVFPYVKNATQIALSFEDPAIAAAAGPIMDQIHAKIDTAASLLYDFGPHPNVAGALQTAAGDLASFESVAGIKSDGAKDAINKALRSLQAFVASVTGAAASWKAPVADPQTPVPPITQ